MPVSFVIGRIAARTAVALWRHRLGWLSAALAIAALGLYQMASAGPSVVNGDCADTTMAAVTSTSEQAARAAYACLNPGLRSASEEAWVAGMRQRAVPRGQFNRVAETRTTDGGQIVFYAVQEQGESVGYIVYLDPQGRVRGVE